MNAHLCYLWRSLLYVTLQVVVVVCLMRASKRHWPRSLWGWVAFQVGMVVIAALGELIPYYAFGLALPHAVRNWKNTVIATCELVAAIRYLFYYREYRAGCWTLTE